MKLLTSRDFNRDVSLAKRAAQVEPVVITDRGQPTHVLMSIAEYRRLTGEGESILELLAMPEAVTIDAADAAADGAKAGQSDAGLSAWAAGLPRQKLFMS
eukprot:gene16842-20589_t